MSSMATAAICHNWSHNWNMVWINTQVIAFNDICPAVTGPASLAHVSSLSRVLLKLQYSLLDKSF